MSFDIIVGAQSGNEGKSKFSRFYSTRWKHYDAAIKIGGYCSNNFYDEKLNRMVTSRMIPAATNEENDMLYIFPRFSYVNLDILKKEAKEREIDLGHIIIDENAIVEVYGLISTAIKSAHIHEHEYTIVFGKINIGNVEQILEEMNDCEIIVEGQGGYRLGKNLHDKFSMQIPMVVPTMTASGIASLLNIGPHDIEDVILVSRIEFSHIQYTEDFLNRVMKRGWETILKGETEIQLEELCILDALQNDFKVRYANKVSEAIYANSPDILVLNFLDLVDSKQGKDTDCFTDEQMEVVSWIEENLGVTVDFIGNGKTRMSHLDDPDEETNETEKDDIKVILPSSRIPSRELYEGKPFEERYRCNCGALYGKINKGFICGNCKQPVVYHEPKEDE